MSTTEARGRVAPSKAEIDSARALAREVGLEYVDLDRYPLNAAASSLLPEQLARRHHALAVGWKYGTPVVAVATPDNVLAMDDIRTVIGRDIHAVVACASQIDAYIERMYSQGGGPVSARAVTPAAPAPAPAPAAVAPPAPPAPPAPAPPPPPPPEAAAPPDGQAKQSGNRGGAAKTKKGEAAAEAEPTAAETQESPSPEQSAEAEAEAESAEALEAAIDAVLPVPDVDEAVASRRGEETAAKAPALAEVLVESGQVTAEEMGAAFREQAATGRPLGEILAELGLVSDEDLIKAMAAEVGMEFVDLNDWAMDPTATALLPEVMARRHQLLAIGFRGDVPIVALANPSDVFALDDLRTLLGREFRTVVSSPRQVAEYISRMYRRDEETEAAARCRRQGQRSPDSTPEARAHRPARGRRGRAHRQVRQPHPSSGTAGASERRPHRALCRRPQDPLPDRRCLARHHPLAEGHPRWGHHSPEGHGEPRHRRAPDPPGRPYLALGGPAPDRPPRGHATDRARREGRDAGARQVERDARSRRSRFLACSQGTLRGGLSQALRHDPRDRPDRVGQVDHALRDPQCVERGRAQPDHRRGPRGVPAAGRQPGAGESEGRVELRERPPLHPPVGPRHHPRR